LLPLLLLSAYFLGCNRGEGRETKGTQEVRIIKVAVEKVEPRVMRDILVLPGETEPWLDVLVPSDLAGRIEWLGPKEGDRVRQGENIARIDAALLKASLDKAQAAFVLTENLLKRRRELHARNIINQEELDRSITEYNLAEGALKQARIEYEKAFIKAPAEGIVNRIYVDEGEFIDRGKTLLHLVNVDRIKVGINVPELDVPHVKRGQAAAITIDALPNLNLEGNIDFISYKADPATKTFLVRVLIENPSHIIRPGMIARVALLRRIATDALSVPLFALVERGGERLIFVEEDGVAKARAVSLGMIERDRVQITEGLRPGELLIVSGLSEIEEGTRVISK
jgi:membrane fusion protein (multidrug efflux system)